MTGGPFAEQAQQYRDLGFDPVPIRPGTKSPAPSGWQKPRPSDDVFRSWLHQYPDYGIGLLLGTPLDSILNGGVDLRGQFLIAVDVDRDDLVEPVRHALRASAPLCAKRGKKGLTFFARGDQELKNYKFKDKRQGRQATLIEVFAAGSQTVIPPTTHPDTASPYMWTGPEVREFQLRGLPEIGASVLDEFHSLCEPDPGTPHFEALRQMVWAGEGGGGNTHDTCVSAVASMVTRGWRDTQIHERIEFAKREACLRSGQSYHWPGSSRAIQEWIDSARRKGMDEADVRRATDRMAADWLIEQHGGIDACRSNGSALLRYQDGHWAEIGEAHAMERDVLAKFDKFNAVKARSAVDTALSLSFIGAAFGHGEQARFMVCTRDGTLDARTLSKERWDPQHELLFQARATFDDGARCALYDSTIRGLFGGDQEKIDVVEEFLGWTFVQDTSFEKVLFIVGPSGIGKTTLMRVLEGLHSRHAISYVAPHDIGEATARAGLVGKLVNVSSEKSKMKSVSDDVLKKVVSGETVETRRYYHDAVPTRLFSRFINTVNDMPDMSDYSDGLARRLLIIDCVDSEKPQKPDVNHPAALLQERDGIFTRWMQALHRLIARGGFNIPESVRLDVTRYIDESSLTAMWIKERCVSLNGSTSARAWTTGDELYADYAAWVERRVGGERWKNLSMVTWGKEVKALGYPSVLTRRGTTFARARRLGLLSAKNQRPEAPQEIEQEPNY